jgi:serine protease Do
MPCEVPPLPRWRIVLRMACAGAAIAACAMCAVPAGAEGLTLPEPVSVAPIAERLANAVVNISTEQNSKPGSETSPPGSLAEKPPGDLFEDFLEKQNRSEGGRRVNSLGSGFIIDPSGLILTNNHVIEGADQIYAIMADGTRMRVVEIAGRDVKVDLALLRVTPSKPLPSVTFGNSSKMRTGDWVMSIGNPFGLGGSVTLGIVSSLHRNINAGPYDEFIQTDAAINRGNSGGPLFNMNGEVIGVNTAIISPTGGSVGIGFAMPSNTVVQAVEQLRKYGAVRRGWLGMRVQKIGEDVAASAGLPAKGSGAIIASITPNGPAAKAGLQPGDVILAFDGQDVTDVRGLPRLVAQSEIGKAVDIRIWRSGEQKSMTARVEKLDEGAAPVTKVKVAQPKPLSQHQLLGLAISAMTDELRSHFGIGKSLSGVVVTAVDPASEASERGIRPGNIIVEVTSEKVMTPASVVKRVRDLKVMKRKAALLTVSDAKGAVRFVAVTIP